MCFVAKFQERSETGNIMRGVNDWETEVERLDELEIRVAKLEDIDLKVYDKKRKSSWTWKTYLQEIGEIDKHIIACLLLPACDV